MLFVFHGLDRPGSHQRRAELRSAHVDYHARRRNPVGGPLLDAQGQPCGTMFIFEADDIAHAEATAQADPYLVGDLFRTWSVLPFIPVDWPGVDSDRG